MELFIIFWLISCGACYFAGKEKKWRRLHERYPLNQNRRSGHPGTNLRLNRRYILQMARINSDSANYHDLVVQL